VRSEHEAAPAHLVKDRVVVFPQEGTKIRHRRPNGWGKQLSELLRRQVRAGLAGDLADLLSVFGGLLAIAVDPAADQHRSDDPGDGPDPIGRLLHPGRSFIEDDDLA
jgi:hypothetical protein